MRYRRIRVLKEHGLAQDSYNLSSEMLGTESVTPDNPQFQIWDHVLGDSQYAFLVRDDHEIYISRRGETIIIEQFDIDEASSRSKGKDTKSVVQDITNANVMSTSLRLAQSNTDWFEEPRLTSRGSMLVRKICEGFSGEVGRALFLISVLACVIKIVRPSQDIRLHKARWANGLNMRTVDRECVSGWFNRNPELGIQVNSDGAFMTRSLAVNTPYVRTFREDVKGPKDEWLELLDLLNSLQIPAQECLNALLQGAIEREVESNELNDELRTLIQGCTSDINALGIITRHISERPNGGARLLELALHSIVQLGFESGCERFSGLNKPMNLKPMRAPDAKAGTVGDVQIPHSSYIDEKGSRFIEYAVDAKFGKEDVDSELVRLQSQLRGPTPQPHLRNFDFVGLDEFPIPSSMVDKMYTEYGVTLRGLTLRDFFSEFEQEISQLDLLDRYASILMKDDSGYGIITEPSAAWVQSLISIMS